MEQLLVFLILILIHRRIELAILSFLPYLSVRMLTIVIAAQSGLPAHESYDMLFPYLIATGVFYSVLVTIHLVKNNRNNIRIRILPKTALISCAGIALLSTAGFFFAEIPGIRSFVLIMAVYFTMIIALSCFLTPVLFRFLLYRKGEKRIIPVTFFSFLNYLFFIVIFFLASLIGLFLGGILLLIPLKPSRKKEMIHYLVYYSFKVISFGMLHSNRKLVHFDKKIFDKSRILILNRQTNFDIFLSLTLHPKVMLFTGKKIWENKFLSKIATLCDFYPVSENPDRYLAELEAKTEEGYSIVIFPETEPGKGFTVNSFDKGAFYLAEKLNCEIIPVITQGSGQYLQNGVFQLKQGFITFKFYPPVAWNHPDFGTSILERTRLWKQFYQDEMKNILDNYYRDPKIYKAQLLANYIYKGALLEWFAKARLKIENNFSFINQAIPPEGQIADMGCGFGMMSYLLGMSYPERKITGIDIDEEKIRFANTYIGEDSNISFSVANVLDFIPDTYDAIILSDIIHYLPYKQHEPVISKCINRVRQGGVVIIQDSNKELHKRHLVSKLFEIMIVFLGINKARYRNICYIGKSTILNIASKHFVELQILDNTSFTSSIFYIIKKK